MIFSSSFSDLPKRYKRESDSGGKSPIEAGSLACFMLLIVELNSLTIEAEHVCVPCPSFAK